MGKNKKGIIEDVIKANKNIKKALNDRLKTKDLNLSNREICKDAKENWGFSIDEGALSKYLNKPYPVSGGLSQAQIIWLCLRYCVPITLKIQGYKPLHNHEEIGLPKDTLVPINVKYSEKMAEENLRRMGYSKKGDDE